MKKDTFYRCILEKYKDDTRIVAVKTTGFTDGEIGLHKEKYNSEVDTWVTTHIPTGCTLTTNEEYFKTRSAALKKAQEIIQGVNFNTYLDEHKNSESYATFIRSRYEQIVTKNFVGID